MEHRMLKPAQSESPETTRTRQDSWSLGRTLRSLVGYPAGLGGGEGQGGILVISEGLRRKGDAHIAARYGGRQTSH